MTLELVRANRLHEGAAIDLAANGGWSESIDDGRAVPTAEEAAALPAVGEQARYDRARAAPSVAVRAGEDCGQPARTAETDAEPESTVCAAYWAY